MNALPRILTTGVDTLVYTAPLEVPNALQRTLDEKRADAQADPDEPAMIDVAGEPFAVLPTSGARYRWLLSGETCTIGLSRSLTMKQWAAKVELGSLTLWQESTREAYRHSRRLLSELLHRPEDGWPARVSRIDYTTDFQGWKPELYRQHYAFVARAKRGRGWYGGCPDCAAPYPREAARFCDECGAKRPDDVALGPYPKQSTEMAELAGQVWFHGHTPNHYRWATGKTVLCRLYNKTLELRQGGNPAKAAFFPSVWSTSDGYEEGEEVWRLELQARRKWLTSVAPEGRAIISNVEDALDHANTVWGYLVGWPAPVCACGARPPSEARRCRACGSRVSRRLGWMELRDLERAPLRARQRPSRCPVHPAWAEFQKVTFGASYPAVPVCRVRRDEAESAAVAPQARGCLERIAVNRRLVERVLDESGGEVPSDDALYQRAADELRLVLASLDHGDESSFFDRIVAKARRRRKVNYDDGRKVLPNCPAPAKAPARASTDAG